MKLRLVTVAKSAPRWADDAVAHYAKRLKRWGGLDETVLKPARFRGDVDAVRTDEGARVLATVGDRCRLVALDERGEGVSTEAFAALVTDGMAQGTGLVFALGGPYGHARQVREAAHTVLSLSPMVLNHQVARVVLVEQLYRALAYADGSPYHHTD